MTDVPRDNLAGTEPNARAPHLLIAWLVIDVSMGIYLVLDGASSLSRITLIAGFATLIWALLRRGADRPISPGGLEGALIAIAVVGFVARAVFPFRPEDPAATLPIPGLALISLAAVTGAAFLRLRFRPGSLGRLEPQLIAAWAVVIAAGAAIAARVAIVAFDIKPTFDVHLIQEAAGQAVLDGTNPYLTYVFYAGYPYWPLGAVVAAGGLLFGDARWLLVVSDAVIVAAFALTARNVGLPARIGGLAAVVYLWNSSGLYVTWQGLPEPVVIAGIAATVALATSRSRAALAAGFALGLAVATKQLAVGLLPTLALSRNRGQLAILGIALALSGAIVAAFAMLDPTAFMRGSIEAHLVEPARGFAVNLLDPLPGIIPRLSVPFVVTAALAGLLALMVRLRWPDSLAGWLASSTALLMVVFGLTGISFVNYYQIALAVILLIVLLPRDLTVQPRRAS